MTSITMQLGRLRDGDPVAKDALWEMIYPWVVSHAHNARRNAQGMASFDTVDVAQEVYLRAAQLDQLDLAASAQLRAYVATIVRSVVVDLGRRAGSEKRGGDVTVCGLEAADGISSGDGVSVMEVEDLLTQLARVDPLAAQVATLKVYSGMENEELALALGSSRTTVIRKWRFARAWLVANLHPMPAAP